MPCDSTSVLEQLLGERERRHDVDLVGPSQHVEVDRRERGQRARAQRARVVHEQVEPTQLAYGVDQLSRCAASVTSPAIATTPVRVASSAATAFEPIGAPGVEHERPPPLGQRGRQRPPQPLRRPGDEGDSLLLHVRLLSELLRTWNKHILFLFLSIFSRSWLLCSRQ